MNLCRLTLTLVAIVAGPAMAAGALGPIKVTFQTIDCSGAAGMASVNADAVSRVQPYTCPNGKALKQVLTAAGSGNGEVYLISAEESVKLQSQIQRVMDARQKALEQQKPIVIQH
ncbi:MAG: hypothetical protein OEV31_01470 [Gammaproteobacteria bacterium]|nr:hypothetical protein [Gammaproteobacteria bacterium]